MLILPIAEDFDKLLQNRGMAAMAPLGKLGRIVEVAVHFVFVLVIGVLRTKHCRTHGAGKVFNMVLALQSGDIRATERATTGMAQELQSPKVVSLTQWILCGLIFVVDGEELGSHNLAAILYTSRSAPEMAN